MAIHFKVIRWKNLLSTGSQFTEISLDRSSTTLIVGENGAGKSSILDSLCFALFNKPFRNITKPQLVNSINQKNLLVEVEFSIGTKQYKIVRGIKPSVFEIFLNGELLNQDAAARDYQKYLEDHVLKLNYKSFTQIVILGSASFTPFMQLSSAHRREVIEDLLDIKIFSVMNDVLKDKQSELKQKIQETENQIELGKSKVKMQQDYIKTLEEDKQKKAEDIQKRIAEVNSEIARLQTAFHEQQTAVKAFEDSIDDKSEKRNSRAEMGALLKKMSEKIKGQEKSIQFYTDNDVCPTCSQDLNGDLKDKAIGTHSHKIDELNKAIETLSDQIQVIEIRLGEISDVEDQISSCKSGMLDLNAKIIAGNNYIQKLQDELIVGSNETSNIDDEKSALRSLAKEVIEISEDKATLVEEKHYLDVAGILLKDTGIKTKVIRQYLPVINKLVNKYLHAMDSFIHFELDESFNETIKSRHRDDFSYASFSEGEKARIDLALLLAWRSIAKMKNSANTNLLLLDEVLDGHLDPNGIDAVLGILTSIQDTNIFVISHSKDVMFDKFRSVIKFVKQNDFSRIE